MEENIYSGKTIITFNQKLKHQLEMLVFEIDNDDKQKHKDLFHIEHSFLKSLLLFIPAVIGFIIHVPLYLAIHIAIKNKAEDHYDSITTGLLFFVYPFYIIIITAAALFIFKSWSVLILFILVPFTLWSYIQLNSKWYGMLFILLKRNRF